MGADPALRQWAAEVERPDREIDLGRAALVLARVEYADLDIGAYLGRLGELAAEAESGCRKCTDLNLLHRVREYLFAEQGFTGNRVDYRDPRNSFLNDVLDRRLGIPITLSLLLIEVGRQLGLAIEGIGLPGHFVTGVRLGGEQILLDPFNGGALLTPDLCADLVARAVGRRVSLTEADFAPVTKRQFLGRMLRNLKGIYWQREEWEKAVEIVDRLLVLEPRTGEEWRDRGVALAHLGDFRRGLADWERYLTDFPNAPDGEKVRGQLRRVRQRLSQLN
ncbi:MAG: tetratricopeptide repeat protein [Candidatus Rokubacteria bacterium]|nr:tetratricopeptide repeat protein [Candidatus Rokubacteria bacterium]